MKNFWSEEEKFAYFFQNFARKCNHSDTHKKNFSIFLHVGFILSLEFIPRQNSNKMDRFWFKLKVSDFETLLGCFYGRSFRKHEGFNTTIKCENMKWGRNQINGIQNSSNFFFEKFESSKLGMTSWNSRQKQNKHFVSGACQLLFLTTRRQCFAKKHWEGIVLFAEWN